MQTKSRQHMSGGPHAGSGRVHARGFLGRVGKKLCSIGIAFLALTTGLMPGCSSGKLDRGTASARISERLAVLSTYSFVRVGRVGEHCGFNPETHAQWSMDPNQDLGTVIATKAGYATWAADGPGYWKVSLTPKGQEQVDSFQPENAHQVLNGCDYTAKGFRVATPTLIRITGILANDQPPAAEYEWKWKLTDLGRALRADGGVYAQLSDRDRDVLRTVFQGNDPSLPLPVPLDADTRSQEGKAAFKKYDDGWRLQLP